jgi:hypothetical protein
MASSPVSEYNKRPHVQSYDPSSSLPIGANVSSGGGSGGGHRGFAEPGGDTVVIQPGSLKLLLGLASDEIPHVTTHVIAWRMTSPADADSNDGGAGANAEGDFVADPEREEALARSNLEISYTKGKQRQPLAMEPIIACVVVTAVLVYGIYIQCKSGWVVYVKISHIKIAIQI